MRGSRDDNADNDRYTYDDEGEALAPGMIAATAMRDVAELTGKAPSGITALEPDDDGGWLVEIEVIEDRRIPSSGDMLATYRAQVTADGELTGLRRIRRFSRGKGDTEVG
ncbi:gas vesicle protein GvpO [Dactylosporangium sp. NPDC000244]|uniref:gas vesicle protein GvpO n=1 Tax=Dactylosporangium sp. NPDC000244 TaxID=3154365 RepID=UPI00332FDDF1